MAERKKQPARKRRPKRSAKPRKKGLMILGEGQPDDSRDEVAEGPRGSWR